MKNFFLVILIAGLAVAGCRSAAKNSESKMDAHLTQRVSDVNSTNSGPAEAQKGFDQEPLLAQGQN